MQPTSVTTGPDLIQGSFRFLILLVPVWAMKTQFGTFEPVSNGCFRYRKKLVRTYSVPPLMLMADIRIRPLGGSTNVNDVTPIDFTTPTCLREVCWQFSCISWHSTIIGRFSDLELIVWVLPSQTFFWEFDRINNLSCKNFECTLCPSPRCAQCDSVWNAVLLFNRLFLLWTYKKFTHVGYAPITNGINDKKNLITEIIHSVFDMRIFQFVICTYKTENSNCDMYTTEVQNVWYP